MNILDKIKNMEIDGKTLLNCIGADGASRSLEIHRENIQSYKISNKGMVLVQNVPYQHVENFFKKLASGGNVTIQVL